MAHAPTAKVLNERLIGRLRLRHLRLLAAMERSETLAQAADEMGITQPAASQMLGELERLVEMQLFDRHRRGMRATPAGVLLAQQSRQMLAGLRYAAEALSSLAEGRPRPVHIGAIPAAMAGVLRPVLPDLRRRMAAAEVYITEEPPDDITTRLQSGSLQVGLLRQSQVPAQPHWRFVSLLEDAMAVVCAPGHRLARRRRVSLAELADCTWSMPQGQHASAAAFMRACDAAGFTPRRGGWQCMSLDLLPALIEDGQLLAAVPRSLIGGLLERRVVKEIPLSEPIRLPSVGALIHVDQVDTEVHAFVRLIQTSMGASLPEGVA